MMMNNFKFNFNNLSSYNRICKIKSTYLNCNSKVIKCQGMKSIRFLNLLIYEYRDVVVKGTQTLKKRMLRVITLQLDRNNNTSISTIHIRYNVNSFRRISKHSFFFFQAMCRTYKIRPEVSDNDFTRRDSSFRKEMSRI